MPSRVLAGREAEVIVAYRAGESTYELGDRYGVSHHAVRRLLLAAGVPMRPPNRHSDLTGREHEAAELYDAGFTYAEVGERLGVSEETVGRVLRAKGTTRKRGRAAVTGHERAIVDAYKAGATVRDLAAKHRVSHGTISAVLRDAGVTPRQGRPPGH